MSVNRKGLEKLDRYNPVIERRVLGSPAEYATMEKATMGWYFKVEDVCALLAEARDEGKPWQVAPWACNQCGAFNMTDELARAHHDTTGHSFTGTPSPAPAGTEGPGLRVLAWHVVDVWRITALASRCHMANKAICDLEAALASRTDFSEGLLRDQVMALADDIEKGGWSLKLISERLRRYACHVEGEKK